MAQPHDQPQPQVLLTGLMVGESPRWHQQRLWLANWGTDELVTVDPAGTSQVAVRVPATIPCSIDWLPEPDGRLLVVSGSRLLRQEPNATLAVHADLEEFGRGFNEIVVDQRGNAYVNGGGFDLLAGEPFKPGIVVLVTPAGAARQVADDIAFGNGMAITPDGATLLVAESYGKRLSAFDIAADGGLSNRQVWADLGDDHPDGICIDADGAVWYADVPHQHCVRVAEGGRVLQTIGLDRGCFACMLGGADGTTLFMLAAIWRGPHRMTEGPRSGQVLTATAPAPGAGRP
jgi:sugar lactone lactonase YvrE